MSHYRRANTAGGSYFFTVVSYRRQPFMCDEIFRTALPKPLGAQEKNTRSL